MVVVLGVLAGGIFGVAIIGNPAVTIPITLELLVLGAMTYVVVVREPDPASRRWLLKIGAGALLIRLSAFGIVHFVLSPYFFAPDAFTYERFGRAVADSWSRGPSGAPGPRSSLSYFGINALFITLLGEARYGAAILNLFAGVWTCLIVFVLGRDVIGVREGRIASVITAVFPSLVLWSVLNIRDSLATFLVAMIVLAGVRLNRRFTLRSLVLVLGGTVLLAWLRDYMAFLVGLGLLLGYGVALRPGKFASTVFAGVLLIGFAAFGASRFGWFSQVIVDDPLAQLQTMRTALQASASSAYGANFDTGTLSGAITFLPFGIAFLLFAPFPWAIESPLQAAAMPETLLWYPLFALAILGMGKSLKKAGPGAMIVLSVLIVVVTIYALVEGNFGTAYRHRAQIMPLFFVFGGSGVVIARAKLSTRRERLARASAARRQRSGGISHRRIRSR